MTNEFECFDVRPLHCNFCFFLQQKKATRNNCAFLLISCLKIYNSKFSHALFFWYKYTHRNYCFRHRQHSYAACNAALAASTIIYIYIYDIRYWIKSHLIDLIYKGITTRLLSSISFAATGVSYLKEIKNKEVNNKNEKACIIIKCAFTDRG